MTGRLSSLRHDYVTRVRGLVLRPLPGASTTTRGFGSLPTDWLVYGAVAVIGVFIRVLPLWRAGGTRNITSDAPRVYGSAVGLLNGQSLYGDSILMHPPGAALFYVPFAALAPWIGDQRALVLSYVAGALLGGVAVLLVAMLLRRFGPVAAMTGCVIYAASPVIVGVDRNAQLELFLTLGILAAMCLLFVPTRPKYLLAGVALGAATVTKIWTAIDLVIVVAFLAFLVGRRGALRFVAGAAIPAACCLMVVAGNISEAIRNVFLAQLLRPAVAQHEGILSRVALGLQLRPGGNGQSIYLALAAFGLTLGLALIALAFVSSGVLNWRTLRRNSTLTEGTLLVLAGLLGLVHLVVVLKSSSYFYHYFVYPLVPLILTFAGMSGILWQRRPAWQPFVAAAVVLWAGVTVVNGAQLPTNHPYVDRGGKAAAWVSQHRCVYGPTKVLALTGAITQNARNGCDAITDDYGLGLLTSYAEGNRDSATMRRTSGYRAAMWEWIERSDGVIVDRNTRFYSLAPGGKTYVAKHFKLTGEFWGYKWYTRVP